MRSSTDVRLNSMEHGLTDAESEALGVHQNKAYAVYDGSNSAPQNPAAIIQTRKLSQTSYRDRTQS